MPKNLFQDMVRVKNSKKNLAMEEFAKKDITKNIQRNIPKNIDRENFIIPNKPPRGHKYGLWLVAAISMIFFLFALSFFFARAEINVNPKIKDFKLNENSSAIKDSNVDGLSFDLVIISGEETKNVPAGESREVSLNAKGNIFLYNAFSSTPQKLSINTKLEGSNGKIYKTTTAIDIPGMSEDGTPGKTEVSVYAGEAGEEYNSDPLDFKILGFKGTSKYTKVYGRGNGSIIGGFKGNSPTISDENKASVFIELKAALKDKLIKKATDQIPNGFILYKDATFLKIEEESVQFASMENSLPLKTKGTLYGFLLSEKELTQKIAKYNITDYDESEVYIPNIKDLTFSLSGTQEISFADVQNINFNLSGNAKIVWKFDEEKFANDISGKTKSDFNQILLQYPNVDSVQLSLSPFWIRTIPSKLKDIKINVNYPK